MAPGEEGNEIVLVLDGEVEVAVWRVHDAGRADLALVDALARLQLTARRLGCSIRLRNPGADLLELLELVGLADLLAAASPSGLQCCGHAECGEQLDEEGVVDPGDPVP